jgi:two-component system, OmpR family, sensor histidine kinase BaeS
MLDRLTRLRVWLLAGMLVTAAVSIAAASALDGVLPVPLLASVVAVILIGEAWLAATVLVHSLSRAFDGMAAQLQQADSEQKRFLADLAHEIATPLSAVSGFAVALVDHSARSPAEREEAADIVVHESERLQQLLDDVRHLHRLELAESVRQEQVDIDVLCAETAQRFRLAADDAGVTLVVCAEQVSVRADPRLIDVVVNNFVSNAIRYTPAGGRVRIVAQRRRSSAVIAVRDTGMGIAPEHLERIFDRLYRVDEARDRATGGFGLGLAIARRAAQSLNGRIEVASTLGEGSEFRLLLPCGDR